MIGKIITFGDDRHAGHHRWRRRGERYWIRAVTPKHLFARGYQHIRAEVLVKEILYGR